MAITTIDQKLAVMEWCSIFEPGLIINETASFSQGDKQQLLWGYPGVLWQELVPPTGLTASKQNGPFLKNVGRLIS